MSIAKFRKTTEVGAPHCMFASAKHRFGNPRQNGHMTCAQRILWILFKHRTTTSSRCCLRLAFLRQPLRIWKPSQLFLESSEHFFGTEQLEYWNILLQNPTSFGTSFGNPKFQSTSAIINLNQAAASWTEVTVWSVYPVWLWSSDVRYAGPCEAPELQQGLMETGPVLGKRLTGHSTIDVKSRLEGDETSRGHAAFFSVNSVGAF